MQIDRIDVFHAEMPLRQPWKTAFSDEYAIDTILVCMTSGADIGWGEAAPYSVPQFSPEWATGCFHLIRDVFAPLLVGQHVGSGTDLQERLGMFKGNQFAKAALDLAWWDLAARRAELPLWRMIGGVEAEVAVGADISIQDDPQALLAAVRSAQDAGFARTKLKFRQDSGVDMVARVRDAFPDATIHIDCNCGFTLEDLPLFLELDRLDLKMIEQPLASDDLLDHARLQERLKTPICLDESITSVHRARKALDIDASRWINIKHGRVGGLTNALEIHSLCQDRQIPCWVGGMLESNVGQGPSLALGTLPGISYPADVFPEGRLYAHDLAEPAITLSGPGTVTAPDRPGHGFVPNADYLRTCLVKAG